MRRVTKVMSHIIGVRKKADSQKGVRKAADSHKKGSAKQKIFGTSALSDIQYLHILVGSLETPHVSYLYTVNLYHVSQIATALLKQLTMLLDLLESTETLSFYRLMLQSVWWL